MGIFPAGILEVKFLVMDYHVVIPTITCIKVIMFFLERYKPVDVVNMGSLMYCDVGLLSFYYEFVLTENILCHLINLLFICKQFIECYQP